jgi:hypothetical protein
MSRRHHISVRDPDPRFPTGSRSTNVGAGCSCHSPGIYDDRATRVPSHPVWPKASCTLSGNRVKVQLCVCTRSAYPKSGRAGWSTTIRRQSSDRMPDVRRHNGNDAGFAIQVFPLMVITTRRTSHRGGEREDQNRGLRDHQVVPSMRFTLGRETRTEF